jgi:hypothetical protein
MRFQPGPINNTIIASTRINLGFLLFQNATLDFNVTEEILNNMLIDVTLSTFNSFNLWSTKA